MRRAARRELRQRGSEERRDWFQDVDKAESWNETETEGERSRVVMWRAHLSTSHLLFYNSPLEKEAALRLR